MRMNKKNRILLLVAAVLLAVDLILAGGAVYAKYVTQAQLSGSIKVEVEIGTITLQEHKAERQNDGSYVLDMTTLVDDTNESPQNEYYLLPGLDVPKDPHVIVTKENDMPVYVFVEIVDSLVDNNAITYTVNSTWKKLDDVTGKNHGIVYVYTGNENDAKAVTGNLTEYILENNTVTVGQELVHGDLTDLGLTFYASMYQVVGTASAKDTYLSTDY